MKKRAFSLPILALTLSATAFSQAPTAQAPPCSAPEYRQFDFWIGDWEVYVGDKLAGTNHVERILDGCVLMENWVGSKGGTGKSFNVYDSQPGTWEQTWVDNAGGVVHFFGTYADGKMSLAGTTYGAKGEAQPTKLTFWNNADGTVRQVWESSADQGKTWSVLFDGLYKRKK
jgi:hypothetical protein